MILRSSTISYFILLLLVAQSGFPFFTGDIWLAICASITAFFYLWKGIALDKVIVKYLLAFALLMLSQVILLGNFLPGPFIGTLVRVLYVYMAIKVIGVNFTRYFVKLIYFFALFSFVMWAILVFVPGAYEIADNLYYTVIYPIQFYRDHVRVNLIFYTNGYWLLHDFPRNAGPFWEGGAFGVYLVLALVFHVLETGKLTGKVATVFYLSILTTFSLGTFFALLILWYGYFILIKNLKPGYVVASLVILYMAYLAYNEYDFLGQKMESRFEKSLKIDDDLTYENLDYVVGRNEQAILDMRGFLKSPIIGQGHFKSYMYGSSASGMTSILHKWGILGFALIFWTMYKSFYRLCTVAGYNRKYALLLVILLMAINLSQSLYGKPFFLGFSFMFLVFSNAQLEQFGKTRSIKPLKIA